MRWFPQEIIALRSAIGDAFAKYDLGILFLNDKNSKAAYYWLTRSLQGGYQKASEELNRRRSLFSRFEEN